jgi:hypothetical protein
MQILGIPFRTIPRKKTKLEFLSVQQKQIYRYSRNAVPNHSVEEKPTQNKTRQPNISIIMTEKTTFDVQTDHFVKLILLDSIYKRFRRHGAAGQPAKMEQVEPPPVGAECARIHEEFLQQGKTGVPPTRGWMLKDSYMFGHTRPYKVQINYLSPSEPKGFEQFGYDSLMKTEEGRRRLMKAILDLYFI